MHTIKSSSSNRLLQTVETPHLAIIHLLRAKGCCSDQKPPKQKPSTGDQESIVKLRMLKSTVEGKLDQINDKMRHIPCAVKLEEEVIELENLVRGLRSENEMRRQEAMLMTEKFNRTVSTRNGSFYQTSPKNSNASQQIEQELQENRRLEDQYHELMQKIKRIHSQNESIVNNYDRMYSASFS